MQVVSIGKTRKTVYKGIYIAADWRLLFTVDNYYCHEHIALDCVLLLTIHFNFYPIFARDFVSGVLLETS